MTPPRGIAIDSPGATRPSRVRRAPAARRVLIEIRWSVAAAALPGSPTGARTADDVELSARIELVDAESGVVSGSMTVRSARGAWPLPEGSDWTEQRPLTGRLAARGAGWTALRTTDGRGLHLELLLRNPIRRPRSAGRLGSARSAYLRTNLLPLLGLAGGRYSVPTIRLSASDAS
jgi:hypothetical protein